MGKRTRGLAAYQRARRQEWLADTLHEIAVLEGRLMGALGLDEKALQAKLYGEAYLTPSEKQDVLLTAAAQVGV
jgi:hypothetical protein